MPPSASTRSTIVGAIQTRLAALTAGSTYNYTPDFARTQFVLPVEKGKDGYIIIDTGKEFVSGADGSYYNQVFDLQVQIFCVVNSNPADAAVKVRGMVQDVYTAIYSDQYWSNTALHTQIERDEINIEHKEYKSAVGVIYCKIRYKVGIGSD